MEMKHPIDSLMVTAMNSIKEMIDVNTIIGDPIQALNNTVIIPISKVGFGFAAGGCEFNDETVNSYNRKEKEENIRCLCPKCLSEYIDNPNYIVRRLDPFAKKKDRCDKCDKAGWDYIVTERNSVRKGKSGSYEK